MNKQNKNRRITTLLAILFETITVVIILVSLLCSNILTRQIGTSSTRAAADKVICEELIPRGGIGDKKVLTVLTELNAERVKAGLPQLQYSIELEEAANGRAVECSTFFSHTRPDGAAWWTIDPNACYGEILAKGYNDINVIPAWMNSQEHKDCILNSNYSYCGIGYYKDIITVEFG